MQTSGYIRRTNIRIDNVTQYFLPPWAMWVQWLATPLLAIAAATIAYRQWKTSRDKLMLDLFDKRYKSFVAMSKIIDGEYDDWLARDALDQEIKDAIHLSSFLFDEDVFNLFVEAVGLKSKMRKAETKDKKLIQAKIDGIKPLFFKNAGRYMKINERVSAKKFDPARRFNSWIRTRS